jgi:hypothetical protein
LLFWISLFANSFFVNSFIETDPSSDNFGNFTAWNGAINLFDADEGVKDKLNRVKQLAATQPVTINNCKAVLSELFTACDPSEAKMCTNPNTESFAVSTNQVCQAVNTPKKLKFESVGEEFDGFTDVSINGRYILYCGMG